MILSLKASKGVSDLFADHIVQTHTAAYLKAHKSVEQLQHADSMQARQRAPQSYIRRCLELLFDRL